MTTRRFAVVAPSIDDTLNQFEPLLRAIKKRGHRVLFCAPEATSDARAKKDASRLNRLGIEFRPAPYVPPSVRGVDELRVHAGFKAMFRDWPAETVFAIGYPAITHAVLAARRTGAMRIVSVCVDVPDFLNPMVEVRRSWRDTVLRYALAKSDTVVFYNHEHQALMRQKKMIKEGAATIVIPGSGVDVRSKPALPLPDMSGGVVFLMAAPLDPMRGVVNYIQAAKQVARQANSAKFLLFGLSGSNTVDPVAAGFQGSQFEIIEDKKNKMRDALARAHVFVYPSHSEGMPFPVVEALAAGRAIITTNLPGCRETVDETVNGYLVPRGDIPQLVSVMNAVVTRPDLIPAMARASRSKAERRFDVHMVNEPLLAAFDL